jgi:threonine dehydratase
LRGETTMDSKALKTLINAAMTANKVPALVREICMLTNHVKVQVIRQYGAKGVEHLKNLDAGRKAADVVEQATGWNISVVDW